MGFLSGLLGGKSNTTTLEAMQTPEQKQAMALLQQFGATGQLGDFKAGESYNFGNMDYSLTPAEMAGGSALEGLLASSTGMDKAKSAYEGILGQTFNPDDPSNEFASFNRQLTRQTRGAADELNRDAAITGNRFGTQISKDKVNLGERVADVQGSKLAELYSQLQDRKLSAAGGLTNLAQAEEAINQNRIQSAYVYGEQQRAIKNQKAQAEYDDWKRAREERMSSINSMSNVMGTSVEWGNKSLTTKSPSTFMKMFGEISPIAGSYNTAKYGYTTNQSSLSEASKMISSLLQGGTTAPKGLK